MYPRPEVLGHLSFTASRLTHLSGCRIGITTATIRIVTATFVNADTARSVPRFVLVSWSLCASLLVPYARAVQYGDHYCCYPDPGAPGPRDQCALCGTSLPPQHQEPVLLPAAVAAPAKVAVAAPAKVAVAAAAAIAEVPGRRVSSAA